MSENIRYPNITGSTETAQLQQVKSYLHQLVEQLNYALSAVESNATNILNNTLKTASSGKSKEQEAVDTFNSIKALIIKSADIVTAYYDEISAKLEGVYVAQSDFGTYAEQTELALDATSTFINQTYKNDQKVVQGDIKSLEDGVSLFKKEINAYIKTGLIGYNGDEEVYGVAVGQRAEYDGIETFNRYAWFTANKLSFFDQNDVEVAYVSDQRLYIRQAEITESFRIGNADSYTDNEGKKWKTFKGLVDYVQKDGSVVTKYVDVTEEATDYGD